jgi:hypothetical protein
MRSIPETTRIGKPLLRLLLLSACALAATFPARHARAADATTPGKPLLTEKRWAFAPPREPSLPEVRHKEWVRNAVDRFILARLEEKGLQPAAPADRRTLLRRVTFDLTGLPPTPKEMDDFLTDSSADAFAKVVDRLLNSPRYGERWARHWLDLVRYTDDFDEAWRYRDWVVKAFNSDLPYHQFIVNQIAGDRIPAREPGGVNADGIVATTLLSLGPWGGIDRKKRLADIVDDQIDTIGRGFLGLTLACARCHDHKYDPITQKDYYGLAGIFYSSRVISDTVYLSHGTHRLRIPLVPQTEVEKHQRHQALVEEQQRKLDATVEDRYADFARSLIPHTAEYLLATWDYQHRPAAEAGMSAGDWATKHGLRQFALTGWLDYLGGGKLHHFNLLRFPIRDYDGEPGVQVWGAHAERPWWGVNTTDHDIGIETFLLPPHAVSINPGTEGGAVAWKSPVKGRVRITGRLTDADPHDGAGVSWVVDHLAGGVRRELSSGSMANGGSRPLAHGRTPERLDSVAVEAGDEVSLQVQLREGDAHYDITNVALTITRLDAPGEWDLARDAQDGFLAGNPHGVWSFYDMAGSNRMQRMPAADAGLQTWHKAAGGNDRPAVEKAARAFQQAVEKGGLEGPLARDLAGIRSPFRVKGRDDAQYLSAEARAALTKLNAEVEEVRRHTPGLPCANGAMEGGLRYSLFPGMQDVPIHIRGNPARPGKLVPRGFPQALHAPGATAEIKSGSGRLELARWIASADNPLTSRVLVNRLWQHHFGEGIVRTPSNFGTLGTQPTHPELLDYLARRFVASGWSVKAMHRLMVLSAAYQQSSHPGRESLTADPDNRLFSRMNRRRLEAEALRDSLMAVSGTLDLRTGGPADHDGQSPRRMLYLRQTRSDRSGFAPLFDGADCAIQVEKRTVSTVAPQALFLMNSPLVAERAAHLANRREVAALGKPEERIQALYRIVFGRPASAEEMAAGRDFIAALPEKAEPWGTYAHALLLSNEFLFVD